MAEKKELAEKKETAPKWKMVPVLIPLDPMNNESHMFASVAGVGSYQIERGIPVEVPEPIAEVVNRRLQMEAENAKLILFFNSSSAIFCSSSVGFCSLTTSYSLQ